MAERKIKDSPTPPPGVWLVTYSDCMTLLLCFFVMLLTFSSFDEGQMDRLAGAFRYESSCSIFPLRGAMRDSYLPPTPTVFDATEVGSQLPTDSDPMRIENPRTLPVILDDDVYKDRKVVYLASDRLFWGEGMALTPDGRRGLERIAAFLEAVPCRAVVGEVRPGDLPPATGASALDRAWAVVEFLTAQRGLPLERFSLSGGRQPVPERFAGRGVVALTLLPEKVY